MFKAVIFDLDGTLLDTLADLLTTLNSVLARHNYPTHSIDECRYLVGHGMRELVRKALPEGVATVDIIDRLLPEFMEEYTLNWNINSRPYPGIAEMLDSLKKRGIKTAILSNKADQFTLLCAEELLGNWKFDVVMGQRNGIPSKPDPTSALSVAAELGAEPSEILYVGDSGIDMQTATRAGFYPLGVLWGFRPESELLEFGAKSLAAHPDDIITLIEK
ncbi:HAD family hydrolase [Chlorobium ferrooxidans]|uniref:phosphoglycolate phosphatase n=1 Tax=Chlorobium ferrooxidans DSM 13031 TaxID=377431 RepID=Q0YST6_9CHLB|nr:HAD family hydrolase [Chlorobium ferrooxidans]EAT59310.1 HAD-superfamily hydrolase subfamily IA, variant 3:HAD-superfamily hydrolase, subfamily IA, variant 1 [Chlorobium ferrooxidans DSM 13031]